MFLQPSYATATLEYTGVVYTQQGAAIENPSFTRYCGFFGNIDSDFSVPISPGLGILDRVNLNGDSCDGSYNLYLDPQFMDSTLGDYHLTEASPYIDAGPSGRGAPSDSDGSRVDIGAFYFPHDVSVEQSNAFQPASVVLSAYPNPFNSETRIRFDLESAAQVEVKVFDLQGRLVRTMRDEMLPAGAHEASFDGSRLTSGVYFVRLKTDEIQKTEKIVLLK